MALELAGAPPGAAVLWLDDSARNVTTGHRAGWYSVLVGRTGVDCPSSLQLRRIHDLPAALPQLLVGGGAGGKVQPAAAG